MTPAQFDSLDEMGKIKTIAGIYQKREDEFY
jgi:hypothetical protein